MVLLLDTDQNGQTGRHGYDFRINQTRSLANAASTERWNGQSWESAGTATLQIGARELDLAVERSVLGFPADKPLGFDFKWTDHIPAAADAIDFLDQGDTAPNARFNHRYDVSIPQGLRAP